MKPALSVYLAVQVALLVGAIATRTPVSGILSVTVVLVGASTLTVTVMGRRPEPLAAWWLVVAAAWTLIGQALATTASGGLTENVSVTGLTPVLLATFPYPLLAAALALLSRVTAGRAPVDSLDAAMVALAGFLLLWAFVIEGVFTFTAEWAVVDVVVPVSALLTFAMAVKVVLGGGLRDAATTVLVLVVAVLLTVTVSTLMLGIGSAGLRSNAATNRLWASHGLLLGTIGLLPSFARPRHRGEHGSADLSTTRLVLFGVLVLVPIIAWAESSFGRPREEPTAVAVLLAASALLLVILVIRLALLARVAQDRADVLHVRTHQLASSVAEQETLQDQLRYQATHDPLTGLANRAVLGDILTNLQERRARFEGALLMLDLDGFKQVNDSYGHPVGDALLVEVARRLADVAPPRTTLARLGGDEFVMLIEGMDRGRSQRTAERVVTALRRPYDLDRLRLCLTASVGVLIINRDPLDSETAFLRDADAALYDAKKAGRDRAVVRDS